jgi:DNA polymerase I-like protein with 3'-5' exonuclease and polymerase domains
MYIAAPGHGFVARDYSGIEAVLVGYLAADQALLRLAGGTIKDVHGFVATTALGKAPDLSWSDADIRNYLMEFRDANAVWDVNGQAMPYKTLRDACKQSIYLSFYLGTPSRMVMSAPDVFPTYPVARWFQDLFFSTFPKVQKWQWAICEEAERHGYITTPDGFRQYFSDVFKYTWGVDKWDKSYGVTAKECVAAGSQHMGFMYSAQAMVALRREFPEVHEGLRLSIHDELLGEYPLDFREEADRVLQQVMERPMKCMPLPEEWKLGSHLAISTEAKWSHEDEKGVHRWSSVK